MSNVLGSLNQLAGFGKECPTCGKRQTWATGKWVCQTCFSKQPQPTPTPGVEAVEHVTTPEPVEPDDGTIQVRDGRG